jgi:flagellar motor switch protein FliN/FliY
MSDLNENISDVLAAAADVLGEQLVAVDEAEFADPSLDPHVPLDEVALEQLDGPSFGAGGSLAPVLDVPVELSVEIGRTTMTIGETLAIGPGSIVSLNRAIGEPVDLLVNGKRIARGEVVAVDEEFGLRVTEVDPAEQRLEAF